MNTREQCNGNVIDQFRSKMIVDLERFIQAGLNHRVIRIFWPRLPLPARVRPWTMAAGVEKA